MLEVAKLKASAQQLLQNRWGGELTAKMPVNWEDLLVIPGADAGILDKIPALLNTLLERQLPDGRIPLTTTPGDYRCLPPILGGLLGHLFRQELLVDEHLDYLERIFPQLLRAQRYWFTHRDPLEEGLVVIYHPEEFVFPHATSWDLPLEDLAIRQGWPDIFLHTDINEQHANRLDLYQRLFEQESKQAAQTNWSAHQFAVQSPGQNAILLWSNEALLEMGNHFGIDLQDLLEWQELGIHMMNEKLWDKEYGIYRAYDLKREETLLSGSIDGLLPLIADIPSQEQAEIMRQAFLLNFRQEGAWWSATNSLFADATQRDQPGRGGVSLWSNWLLHYGFLKYDFSDLAQRLLRDSLQLVSEFGYHLHFKADRHAIEHLGIGPGNLPGAVGLSWDLLRAYETFSVVKAPGE
ncbi:MAG: hypothetical protein H6555_13165 [Lewinellaceae bacterium]|nr:hypothetical protein [Lewinellaceae bacterium]